MTNNKHIYLIIAAASILVYGSTAWHGFVWDDLIYIVGKSPIHHLANIPFFFRSDISGGTTFQEATPYYRPLLSTVTALMYAAWGKTAAGYHLANILANIGIAILVYQIGLRFSLSASGSLMAALFYSVHPVHAEPVAYLGGNGELLYTFCYLASFLLYLKSREEPGYSALFLSGACYFAGLLIKESCITLPLLILIFELGFVKDSPLKKLARGSYYLAIAACYLVLRMNFVKAVGWEEYRITDRIFTSFGIVAGYLKNTLAPFWLKVFYDIPVKFSFLRYDVVLPLLALLAVLAALVILNGKDRRWFFFGAWFFIALAPASGIPAIISPAPMADRYLCLPLVGVALLFGLLYAKLHSAAGEPDNPASGRTKAMYLSLGFGIILATLALMTINRLPTWKTHERFVRQMIADAPEHYLGYDLMGTIYGERGDNGSMAGYYLQAKQKGIAKSLQWAGEYMNNGRTDEAITIYERLLRKIPDLPEAANGLGLAMMAKGDRIAAQRYFLKALQQCPTCEQYRNNLRNSEPSQQPDNLLKLK